MLAKEHAGKGHFVKLQDATVCARESIYNGKESEEAVSIAGGEAVLIPSVPLSGAGSKEGPPGAAARGSAAARKLNWVAAAKRALPSLDSPGNVSRIMRAASNMGCAKSRWPGGAGRECPALRQLPLAGG